MKILKSLSQCMASRVLCSSPSQVDHPSSSIGVGWVFLCLLNLHNYCPFTDDNMRFPPSLPPLNLILPRSTSSFLSLLPLSLPFIPNELPPPPLPKLVCGAPGSAAGWEPCKGHTSGGLASRTGGQWLLWEAVGCPTSFSPLPPAGSDISKLPSPTTISLGVGNLTQGLRY